MQQQEIKYIGIRREDWSIWERRTPITPRHVEQIHNEFPNIKFIVQPCGKRAFRDEKYQKVGAIISEDLSKCSLIVSIKRPKDEKTLLPNISYIFFGHVHKAQESNMPLLKAFLEKNIRFFDIEHFKDERHKRILYFGKYGGIAGTIDFLASLGQFILQNNLSTPFLHIKNSYNYFNIKEAYDHIEQVGDLIINKKLPKELCPMIFGVIGDGKVANGTWQVLSNLPIKQITPDQIASIFNDRENPEHRDKIYVATFSIEHIVKRKDQGEINHLDYYKQPELYTPIFHEQYLPYISVIFNNIYWENRFPRLISNEQMKDLVVKGKSRLLGVCDVTCDLKGSIEFLQSYTSPDKPAYVYDPINEKISFKIRYQPGHILYMAYDSLASELGEDASEHCSKVLYPYLHHIVETSPNISYKDQHLPHFVKNAMVTCNGQLTEPFQRIQRILDQLEKTKKTKAQSSDVSDIHSVIMVKLVGHLFDKMVINKIFEQIQAHELKSQIADQYVGGGALQKSSITLQVFGNDSEKMKQFKLKLIELCKQNDILLEDLLETRDLSRINQIFRTKL